MISITKLAPALAVIAAVSLLVFAAEIIYILYYRRKLRRAAGPTGDSTDRFSPKNLLLSALCCFKRKRSRVEPAATPPPVAAKAPETAAPSEEEIDLARWRAACLGPMRVLYTIKEEEEREEADSDLEKGFGFGSDKDDCKVETPYYTPESSPARV